MDPDCDHGVGDGKWRLYVGDALFGCPRTIARYIFDLFDADRSILVPTKRPVRIVGFVEGDGPYCANLLADAVRYELCDRRFWTNDRGDS